MGRAADGNVDRARWHGGATDDDAAARRPAPGLGSRPGFRYRLGPRLGPAPGLGARAWLAFRLGTNPWHAFQ